MKYNSLVLIAVLCAFIGMASSVFAGEGSCSKCGSMPGHGKMGPVGHDEWSMFIHKAGFVLKNAQALGLTEDQAGKIKASEYNFQKSLIKGEADLKSLGLDIKEALRKDAVDLKAVNGLIDQKYAAKAQAAKEDVAARAELKTILTKEQQQKLKDICTAKMEEMEGREKGREGRKGHENGMDRDNN